MPAWIILFKLGQFQNFELMLDSGIWANIAWNTAHGQFLHSSATVERSLLAIKIDFMAALVSPILWIWNSTAALAAVQAAAIGSCLLGIYLLSKEVTKDEIAPWLLVLLAMSQHFYHDLVGTYVLGSVYAAPLFIWAAYCWQSDRRRPAMVLGGLLLLTSEAVPFIVFGIGLYFLWTQWSRNKGLGISILLASIGLWFLEMFVIRMNQQGFHEDVSLHWVLYRSVGGSPEGVLDLALHRPWIFAKALVYPSAKLWTATKLFAAMALLPAASGAAIFPVLTTWLPHQLAEAGTYFHLMSGYAASFIFGPLILSAAYGFRNIFNRVRPHHHARLLAGVLLVSGINFFHNGSFLLPPGTHPANWKTAGPQALAHIPPEAKVWCDEFFMPYLALRRYVKQLPPSLPNIWFENELFLPDRVLLSLYWPKRADKTSSERIMDFLQQRGFLLIFQNKDLVVLANPKSLEHPATPLEKVAIP